MELRSTFLYIKLKKQKKIRIIRLEGLFCQVFLFVEHILFVQ